MDGTTHLDVQARWWLRIEGASVELESGFKDTHLGGIGRRDGGG